jgi:hypothetical protein
MNWKDIYTEANSVEREQIVCLLMQRTGARAEQSKMNRRSYRVWWDGVVERLRRRLFRPRHRVHWLGQRPRLPRPERVFILLTFLSAMWLLEPREYAIWSMMVGSFTSVGFAIQSVRRVASRRRPQRMRIRFRTWK